MAGPVITFNHTAAASVASGDLPIDSGGFLSSRNLLIACIAYRGNAAFTAPAGWTKEAEINTGNTDDSVTTAISSIVVFSKPAANIDATYTFTRTGGDIATGKIIGVIAAVNVKAVVAATLAAANTNIATAAGITADGISGVFIFVSGARVGTVASYSSTDPAGADYTELQDFGVTTGAGVRWALASAGKAGAGATGVFSAIESLSARHSIAGIVINMSPSVVVVPTQSEFKFSTANPTVILSSIVVEPNTSVKFATVDPTLFLSNSSAAPAPSAVRLATVDPVAATSSVTVAPAVSAVRFPQVNPTVKAELVVPPSEIVVRLQTTDPTVSVQQGPKFNPEAPVSTTWSDEASLSGGWSSEAPLSNTWTPETPL